MKKKLIYLKNLIRKSFRLKFFFIFVNLFLILKNKFFNKTFIFFFRINIIENKYPINEQDSPSCSNYPAIKNIKLELLPETNYFENDNFINKQNVSQLDNLSKNIKHENLHETNIIDNKQTFIEQNITNPLKMSILTNKIDNLNLSSDLNNIKNKQKFDEKSFFNCSKKIREIEEEDSLSELSDFELKEPINNQNFLSFFQLKSLIRKILEDENKKNSLKKNQSNNEQKLNVSEIENLIRHIITIMLSEGVQLNIKKDSLINSKIQNKTEIINNYEKKQKLSKCNSTTNLKTIKPTRKIPISNKNINENQQDFLSYSKV